MNNKTQSNIKLPTIKKNGQKDREWINRQLTDTTPKEESLEIGSNGIWNIAIEKQEILRNISGKNDKFRI